MKKQVKGKRKAPIGKLLPLFIITVSFVFAVLFTVILIPSLPSQIGTTPLFIILLVVATTVSSTVAIIFYLIFKKEI